MDQNQRNNIGHHIAKLTEVFPKNTTVFRTIMCGRLVNILLAIN